MTEWWQILAVLVAGLSAGFLNAVVGSGTLITFPTLLALGVPPVTANMSNTVGLAPGGFSAVLAGRRDLSGQRRRVITLGTASLLGGIVGALLLLWLPAEVFSYAVPPLIAVGCILVVAQPHLVKRTAARRKTGRPPIMPPVVAAALTWWAVLGAGVYGGYFGAAQGVIVIGVLGLTLQETLPRLNVVKNVLTLLVNGVAALIFIAVRPIDWLIAGLIAGGAIIGAQIGGRVGRRLPSVVYRSIIVTVGVVAIGNEVWKLARG
ncbi:sulfite exporter TauE/SafE family protein [Microlunatus sp. Y2014]|uniref:sulfite exporter TauE/SafE family protein n=1 Tax=Microlunatus sp. Y2014 TaxID=3418488 RepID=UPI003DA710FE